MVSKTQTDEEAYRTRVRDAIKRFVQETNPSRYFEPPDPTPAKVFAEELILLLVAHAGVCHDLSADQPRLLRWAVETTINMNVAEMTKKA